ncbi:MAG: Arsenate reductase [Synergistaceae bacterium]
MQNNENKVMINCTGKPKVAFVCVHNSCRSQIAEALGKKLASEIFESYSGGTELKDRVNQDAVRLMKSIHSIDMEKDQHSKLIFDIPDPDVVIKMEYNVTCPPIEGAYEEDWGLDDPMGKENEVFIEVINTIEKKILELKEKISCNP